MPVFHNFGDNQLISPLRAYTPHSERELLRIMGIHRGMQIRVRGRLHSWSAALQSDSVLLDMRHFNEVRLERDADGPLALIGGGCQIKRVLKELALHGLTLPSIGLITEQTIAGATATGTHGSGKHSLSHYLTAVRVASFDPHTGDPVIREICDGDELRAARCALGCLGVIVSVELRPRPEYNIEEWLDWYPTLDGVLAREPDAPLQQFHLMPWRWRYLAQHRREVARPRGPMATMYRLQWWLGMDLFSHFVMLLCMNILRSRCLIKIFYKNILPCVLTRNWNIIDSSERMLTMDHERFRHIEIEVFVRRDRLAAAIEFVRQVILAFDGSSADFDQTTRETLAGMKLLDTLTASSGTYTHHYPICIRRVLPDDTLLSMTCGGDQDWYAISLISYELPHRRGPFLQFAHLIAHGMAALFDARCHWGKICPLSAAEVARLYPRLPDFQAICRQIDPNGTFQNDWTRQLLLSANQPPS